MLGWTFTQWRTQASVYSKLLITGNNLWYLDFVLLNDITDNFMLDPSIIMAG